DRVDVRDVVEVFEQLRERDLLQLAALLDAVALFAFVAQVAARLDAARAFAQERDREAPSQRVVVDAHRRGIENLDRVRRIVRIEDRDGEIVAVDDLDLADDERVLARKELMPALVARADFVEDAVRDEPVENLAKRRDRGERLRPVPARVNDLQVESRPSSRSPARAETPRRRRPGQDALHETGKKPSGCFRSRTWPFSERPPSCSLDLSNCPV